jgi:hypothetical protein
MSSKKRKMAPTFSKSKRRKMNIVVDAQIEKSNVIFLKFWMSKLYCFGIVFSSSLVLNKRIQSDTARSKKDYLLFFDISHFFKN